jgi:hypothetical protein
MSDDESSADADYHDEQERENRRKAQELIERRDAIRSGGYDPEEEAHRLKQVTGEYKTDVQRKAAELEALKSGASPDDDIKAASLEASKKLAGSG